MRYGNHIKNQLLLIFGIIAMSGVVYFSFRSHSGFRDTMISQTQQQLLIIAKTTARNVEEAVALPSGILQRVSRDALLQKKTRGFLGDDEQLGAYTSLDLFLMLYGMNINTLYLFDDQGEVVQTHETRPGKETSGKGDIVDRLGVQQVLDEKKANVGSAFFNSEGDLTFSVSEPLFDGNQLIGVIQRIISLERLSKKLFEPLSLHGQTRGWMFDDRDVIVSHPNREFVGMSIADILSLQHEKKGEHFHPSEVQDHITKSHGYFDKVRVESEGGGIFVSFTTDGNELVSYKGIEILDRKWGLVVTLPYHVIAGPIAAHARKVFGMAVFIVMMFSGAGLYLLNARKREAELEAEAKYLKPLAQSAEALREGEKRFRDLVENSLVGILIIQDGRVVYQNPEQERLFGILPDRFNFGDFQNFYQDDGMKFQEFFNSVSAGKPQISDLEIRFYPLEQTGGASTMRWALCRASHIHFEGRDAVLINMIDITRAKELEQLVMAKAKMVSLGHVAAGIAHEIRNPLSGINIHLSTLSRLFEFMEPMDEQLGNKIEKILAQLKSASARIEMVIRKVMDFAKPGHPHLVKTDLNEALIKAMDLTAVTLRKSGILLKQTLARDLPPCRADSHLIEQVILNLMTNSAQAMKNMTGEKAIQVSSALEDNKIVIRVEDSGPGVPEKDRTRIFDPFFTTKSDSSGIGLSLCHRIISDHGGVMRVETSGLGGAEFRIELPV